MDTVTRPHVLYSVGNLKIGKDTIIVNITPAMECSSLRLGLCQVPKGECYAWHAEKQYPQCLPYRRRQTAVWDALSPDEIAEDIRNIKLKEEKRKNAVPVRYLRMQESGDFRNQADVDKVSRVADLLAGTLRVYTYSARRDLDFSRISHNMIVNGSGFMATNNFKVCTELPPDAKAVCKCVTGGYCIDCKLCKTGGGKTIYEVLRTNANRKKLGKVILPKDLAKDEHGGFASLETMTDVAPAIPAGLSKTTMKKIKKAATRRVKITPAGMAALRRM